MFGNEILHILSRRFFPSLLSFFTPLSLPCPRSSPKIDSESGRLSPHSPPVPLPPTPHIAPSFALLFLLLLLPPATLCAATDLATGSAILPTVPSCPRHGWLATSSGTLQLIFMCHFPAGTLVRVVDTEDRQKEFLLSSTPSLFSPPYACRRSINIIGFLLPSPSSNTSAV